MESHGERLRRMNALLIDAIVLKAHTLVTGMLDMGADVNHTVLSPLLKNMRGDVVVKSDASICLSSGAYTTPLHVAVLHYLLYTKETNYPNSTSVKDAFEIVKILLNYGANINRKSTNMFVCNIKVPSIKKGPEVIPGGTPLETATFVIKDMFQNINDWFTKQLIYLLTTPPDNLRSPIVPTMTMPTVVYQRWCEILTEGTFSDVTFVCVDGKEVKAHTAVLAHASEYFRRLFEGPWKKESLHLDVPAEVMHGILSHVYIGEIDVDVVARHAADFLRLSQEYFLSDLEALSDAHLARNVTLDNLETLLILSELHCATKLKESCLDFVCSNKATALTRMMHLAKTHPDLWIQMVEVASANEPAHKKLRAS